MRHHHRGTTAGGWTKTLVARRKLHEDIVALLDAKQLHVDVVGGVIGLVNKTHKLIVWWNDVAS